MGEPWRAIVGAAWASLPSQLTSEPEELDLRFGHELGQRGDRGPHGR